MSTSETHTKQMGTPATEQVTKTKPKAEAEAARPPMYKVILMNDDFTPMYFVVQVLKAFFNKPHIEAINLTLAVHNQGQAICGVFTRDVAETKVDEVITFARMHEHPLQCTMERA